MERGIEHFPHRLVRGLEPRIAGGHVDGADHRARRADLSGRARGAYQLIEQLADTTDTGGAGAAFQPGQVIGLEGHGDRLLGHMFIRYRLTMYGSTMYPRPA